MRAIFHVVGNFRMFESHVDHIGMLRDADWSLQQSCKRNGTIFTSSRYPSPYPHHHFLIPTNLRSAHHLLHHTTPLTLGSLPSPSHVHGVLCAWPPSSHHAFYHSFLTQLLSSPLHSLIHNHNNNNKPHCFSSLAPLVLDIEPYSPRRGRCRLPS